MKDSELKYWVARRRVPSIGRARFQLLLTKLGSLGEAWHASRGTLTNAGLNSRSAAALSTASSKIDPDAEMEQLAQAKVRAMTWNDPEYPSRLKEIYDPHPVLFIKGTLLPEDQRAVTIVGTRRATAYGRETTAHLSAELARTSVTIVSGLARGIDAIAHRTALEAGGRTIAIVANGLDIIYPPEHTSLAAQIVEHDAVVSEHPLGTRPEARQFPRRNRIMSGMTPGTLVVEAPVNSGAILTVRHALEQDRKVFCVPGQYIFPQQHGNE